ncbi:MAG: hypothetical protein KIG16_01760 [Eubacteriales bacterium]|nr:hypothetical protein [Eubacteriales bacterium]
MKKALIIIGLIILALVVAVVCKVPALEWIAKVFDVVKLVFATLANCCRFLQKLVNWGFIK